MGLFESTSESEEFLWVAEALAEGTISHGQMLEVTEIIPTSTGNGYILKCEAGDGTLVYDFAYKKSKPGKTLSAMFADPEVANGWQILVKSQDKKRCAVCDSVACEGLEWNISYQDDRETLVPTKKAKSRTRANDTKQSA